MKKKDLIKDIILYNQVNNSNMMINLNIESIKRIDKQINSLKKPFFWRKNKLKKYYKTLEEYEKLKQANIDNIENYLNDLDDLNND